METAHPSVETVMSSTPSVPGKRRVAITATTIVAIAVLWYLFRPELLFVNKSVNEGFPTAGAMSATVTSIESPLTQGRFHSGAHETKGTASIYVLKGGLHVLRLTDFATSNGPDVHVFLGKAADATDSDTVKNAGYIDLGSLKGNIGDQNYALPADTQLSDYKSVTIWCSRFSVNFGTAPLKVN